MKGLAIVTLPGVDMVRYVMLFTLMTGGIGLATAARAQSTDPVDPTLLGPQVGETVPDFTLRDHRGQERTLASLYGPKGLMLVFNRSANW